MLKKAKLYIVVLLIAAAILLGAYYDVVWGLWTAVIVIDGFIAFSIFAWCPGNCRYWWDNFFNSDQRIVKIAMIAIDVVLLFMDMHLADRVMVLLLTFYIGWYNVTYYAVKSYLRQPR